MTRGGSKRPRHRPNDRGRRRPKTTRFGEAGWRASLGRAHAHTGLVEKAEILAKEAVEIVLATEHLLERADAFRALADVLDVAGRSEEAVEAAGLALQGYRKKGLTEKAHPVKRLESMLRSQPNA